MFTDKGENKNYKIFVSGRVQGVYFRVFTYNVARSFGLKGYVKNLDDGRVYIEVEGKQEKIDLFLEEIKKGPPLAKVKSLKIEKSDELKNYNDFEIRY